MNLMKNAMKFTSNGKIKIRARYEGQPSQMLVVKVIDTGSGIAPEDMAALFSRFGKLLRTAAMNSEGIGLGLMIVKQIVESASGHVKVFSEGEGKGSTFSFSMLMPSASLEHDLVLEPQIEVEQPPTETYNLQVSRNLSCEHSHESSVDGLLIDKSSAVPDHIENPDI